MNERACYSELKEIIHNNPQFSLVLLKKRESCLLIYEKGSFPKQILYFCGGTEDQFEIENITIFLKKLIKAKIPEDEFEKIKNTLYQIF